MCGIVGFIRINRQKKLFNLDDLMRDLLFFDTLRGIHSTGFFGVYEEPKLGFLHTIQDKMALPGPSFTQRSEIFKTAQRCADDLLYFVGHNRYATGGQIIDANAHPFNEGSVTLVHNGVIRNRYEVAGKYHDVDSQSAAHFLDKYQQDMDVRRFAETAEGAYSLVWQLNLEPLTLHFFRNKERPMHFVISEDIIGFGSEPYMVAAAMERNGFKVLNMQELPVFQLKKFIFPFEKIGDKVQQFEMTELQFENVEEPTTKKVTGLYGTEYDSLPWSGYGRWKDKTTTHTQTNNDESKSGSNVVSLSGKVGHTNTPPIDKLSATYYQLQLPHTKKISHKSVADLPKIAGPGVEFTLDSPIMFCATKHRNLGAMDAAYVSLDGEMATLQYADVKIVCTKMLRQEAKELFNSQVMAIGFIERIGRNDDGEIDTVYVRNVTCTLHQDPIYEASLDEYYRSYTTSNGVQNVQASSV